MSDLLEKAIIDAKALKEAALKNAEQLVIEKYSQEIKQAMTRILEEEDENLTEAPEDDPMADLFGDDAQTPTPGPEDPNAENPATDNKIDSEDIRAEIPDSFRTDEEELISIQLDSLEDDFDFDDTGAFASGDELGDDDIGIDLTDDEVSSDVEATPDIDTTPDTEAGLGIDVAGIEPAALEEMIKDAIEGAIGEQLEQEEIESDELAERVRVEGMPQKSGWAGTPESIMQEYEALLLATEQDTEVKEQNAELRKIVSNLQKENKKLTSAARKLVERNKKYESAFDTLQEKLETMNVSNAKLLYINQALENASLNERQKRKIVEAISKAETVQEAKIVFNTITETVSTTLDAKKEMTLNEMVSRKSSLLVAARKEQPTKDANPMYTRLQKLAGIKTT
tara:strand:+ start:7933 stop:9123 length:1191 start_codon:yes stop_codon:yes gene_type:complete